MHNLKSRPYYKLYIFVLLIAICFFGMNAYEPPAEKATEGYSAVIVAFEFVQNPTEVKQLLGGLSNEEIKGLDMLNYIDFIFMIAYSGFLLGFINISRKSSSTIFLAYGFQVYLGIAVLFPVIVCFSDLLENLQLLNLTSLYFSDASDEQYVSTLYYLNLFTWMKWGSLALIFTALAPVMFMRGIFSKILGVILLVPFVLMIIAWSGRDAAMINAFATSTVLSIVLLIVYSLVYKK